MARALGGGGLQLIVCAHQAGEGAQTEKIQTISSYTAIMSRNRVSD